MRPPLFTLLVPTGEPQRVPQLLVNVSGPTCCLPGNADYSRAWLSLTVSGTSKYIISLKISSFQLTEKEMPRQPGVCVCVCMYVCTAASSKGEAAILPGIGRKGRPTWLQAAFNYPESHFNEVLPNALNHSIFHGTRLSAAVLELGGEQASDPSPRTPFWVLHLAGGHGDS